MPGSMETGLAALELIVEQLVFTEDRRSKHHIMIRRIGGRAKGRPKCFAVNRLAASIAGKKGGTISRRGKLKTST